MSETTIISLEVPSDLSQWTAEQGKKAGGNRSTFIRGLIISAKDATNRIPMEEAEAARAIQPAGLVSMKQLRAAKRKGGAR